MEAVNIVIASELLGICRQRIQQLIYANRVKGAFKTKKGWQIPLYNGMPSIATTRRGMKGTWRTSRPKRNQVIHVNSQTIKQNIKRSETEPVIAVRQGSKVRYGHEVYFEGKCTIIYRPDNKKENSGAKVWIEVSPTTPIKIINWDKSNSNPRITLN